VVVVSGLARGIDGAAHAGALAAPAGAGPPLAVVGTGLDVVYPSANRRLWEQVADQGAVLSESPLGTPPLPRVFPARNRIIAALADVVVVVESHHAGGALYTAEAAARRGIPVCAVPGSVRSRASDGTNGLLVDGCTPVRDAADVLVAVSLAGSGGHAPEPAVHSATLVAAWPRLGRPGSDPVAGPAGSAPASPASAPARGGPELTDAARSVLGVVEDTPTSIEAILSRSGLSIAAVGQACADLQAAGLLRAGAGWWSKR
jgi:DNA processing protein